MHPDRPNHQKNIGKFGQSQENKRRSCQWEVIENLTIDYKTHENWQNWHEVEYECGVSARRLRGMMCISRDTKLTDSYLIELAKSTEHRTLHIVYFDQILAD